LAAFGFAAVDFFVVAGFARVVFAPDDFALVAVVVVAGALVAPPLAARRPSRVGLVAGSEPRTEASGFALLADFFGLADLSLTESDGTLAARRSTVIGPVWRGSPSVERIAPRLTA
jgi:hypothetical protein